MWTIENRARYDRSRLRYPSDLTDAEWALIELHIPPAKPGGNKRTVNLREIANGLMYILSTAFHCCVLLVVRAWCPVVFLSCTHHAFRARAVRLAGDLAALRRDADFAAGLFSAAMLRRSASIRFTTFSAAGFTGAG